MRLSALLETLQGPNQAALTSYIKWLGSARPKQITPEGDWNIWLILAGRGWGKTRTGAQDIASYAQFNPNTISAVVAPTQGDLRRVCFDGPSGLMSIIPEESLWRGRGKAYNRGTMEIHLANGSIIQGYAAIEPDRLRGPQYHRVWADELAAWRYDDAWDQLQFGLRLGDKPQAVVTTTPRPTALIRALLKRPDIYKTSGNTFENTNLAESALATYRQRYEGTRLGRQELYAEILDDVQGALWSYGQIEKLRTNKEMLPEFSRVVVAIDPAMSVSEDSDETGIVVAGRGQNGKYYVLEDASGKYSPDSWARKAVDLYYLYKADRIVAEVNSGGDMVQRIIRTIDLQVPFKAVHATRGKLLRAEPISALYEQEKVFHVGSFSTMEDQMCSYTGVSGKSPDRLDALVWALTELSQSSGTAQWRVS
jgi:predicted phage terminase large subunit-like protein